MRINKRNNNCSRIDEPGADRQRPVFEVVIICAIGFNIDRSPAKNDRSKVFWS